MGAALLLNFIQTDILSVSYKPDIRLEKSRPKSDFGGLKPTVCRRSAPDYNGILGAQNVIQFRYECLSQGSKSLKSPLKSTVCERLKALSVPVLLTKIYAAFTIGGIFTLKLLRLEDLLG